jgi:sulfite oxidase
VCHLISLFLAVDRHQPLPEMHGFPLRVVVPGYIGARSVKWLTRIKVLEQPSWAPVQRKEYLYYSNMQVGKHNSSYSNGFSIQDMPVSSAILQPKAMDVIVHDGSIELQGWAYSGGENWVERVEVSLDGGHTWYSVPNEGLSGKHYYTWRLWKISVPCDAEGWIDAMVRAWDSCCNTQPTFVRSAWNWDLHVVRIHWPIPSCSPVILLTDLPPSSRHQTSSCHKMKIYSVNRSKPLTARRLEQYKQHGMDFEKERITMPIPFEAQDAKEYEDYMRKFPREPVD